MSGDALPPEGVDTWARRTAVAEQNGAKTQLTGVVGAVAITIMLIAVPGLLRNLPLIVKLPSLPLTAPQHFIVSLSTPFSGK